MTNKSKKSEKLWDCDDNFWGAPSRPHDYKIIHIEKDKKFTGNKFVIDLKEGQAIDANEQKNLGVDKNNLKISPNTTVSGEIVFEDAANHNSLGVFTINKNGTIGAVSFVVPNTNDSVGATFEVEAGKDAKSIGFFIASDGGRLNNHYEGLDFSTGKLEFLTNYNQPNETKSKITDNGANVSLVFTAANGEETVIQGNYWFTSERGGSNSLNSDGLVHAASGIDGNDKETLKIAFEDKIADKADRDYNDVVFTVQMKDEIEICVPVPPKCKDIIDYCDPVTSAISDYIKGTAGNDNSVRGDNTIAGLAKAAAVLLGVSNITVEDHHVNNTAA